MIALFSRQLKREFLLQLRQMRFWVNTALFFLSIVLLFPLTLKPEISLLRLVVPGLVWIAMLLSFLLASERLFDQDFEHGVLEQWLASGQPLAPLIIAKILAHWFLNTLPLFILCPLIGLLFALSAWEVWILVLSLFCGTPALLFLCALAASFSVGVQQKGALIALIVLPLTLPVLILGSGAVSVAMEGLPCTAYLALLTALSLSALGLLPYAVAGVIRISYGE